VTAPASLPIVPEWFSVTWVTGATACLNEPHVDGLLRANVWYLRGRERDLLVDTGNGIAPLAPVVARLARGGRRPIVAIATHAHIDHIGGLHEFEHRLLHPLEQAAAAKIGHDPPLATETWSRLLKEDLEAGGSVLAPVLVDAVPDAAFDPVAFRITTGAPTQLVGGGDVIDLCGRRLHVVDLPGHTPGSIGLVDETLGALLSGDAIYDGRLIDSLPESDVETYVCTMERLRTLEVDAVYPGHGDPFGQAHLRKLAEAYIHERTG
jgi:glyoxylase-like metal-dependent hydrolase (beta-lactamase superfamily II)